MKLFVCTIYDNAAQVFSQPMFFRSKAEAVRSFSDAVADEATAYNKHPSDYGMFAIGEYDDNVGLITAYDMPLKIITALECVKSVDAS